MLVARGEMRPDIRRGCRRTLVPLPVCEVSSHESLSVGRIPYARLPVCLSLKETEQEASRDQVRRVGGLDPASQLLAPLAYQLFRL
jgi:hypothetical protein